MQPLYILTTATDKTRAAVISTTNITPVSSMEQMVLGDSAALTILFTDGTAAPSWAGQAGYSLTISLGSLDVNGGLSYASSTGAAFTGITGGWSGRLSLATQLLIDAMAYQVGSAVDWSRYHNCGRLPGPRPQNGWFNLQIAVTDPSGFTVTYAELRVPVLNRVMPPGTSVSPVPESAIYAFLLGAYAQRRSLLGIAATAADSTTLEGITTANIMPVGATIIASFPNNIQAMFELVATTGTSAGFIFPPWDYHVTINPVKWRLRAVWIIGQTATYNNDTGLWHYLVCVGAANAVAVSCEQAGTALPT